MSQSTGGPCLVCGKEALTRCQACGKAGISLFFCSKEHQRVLWPVHKLVCGPSANPFTFPGLSQGEADEAKRNLDVPFPMEGGESVKRTDMLDFIDGLVPGHPSNYNALTPAYQQYCLILVRATRHARLILTGWRPTTPIDILCTASFILTACCITPIYNGADKPIPTWHHFFTHLLLTNLSLHRAYDLTSSPTVRSELEGTMISSFQRMVDFAQSEVRAVDPTAADRIVAVVADDGLL
ncbi:hypothetical protein JCM8097_003159 [Rhodosporidiobolus ruineniae]